MTAPCVERSGSRWWDPAGHLVGINLRSWLVVTVTDAGRPVTVAELTDGLRRTRFVVRGRESKTVSDALRWEVRKGHLRRLGRGVYAPGRIARTNKWRMRRRLEACRVRLDRSADSSEAAACERELLVLLEIARPRPVVAPTWNATMSPCPPAPTRGSRPPP